MPRTYEVASENISRAIEGLMTTYHPALASHGVTLTVLLAHASRDANGDPSGAAIELNGYPCHATIKIVSLKDRVAGKGDAELVIDGDELDTWSNEQFAAIIDHELTHLKVMTDKQGNLKRDDIGRPVLKIRKHDHQYGWFEEVIERHGDNSFELQQLAAVGTKAVQQGWLKGF